MLPEIEKIKGVPPGAVLKWALKKKGIGPSVFAMEIGVFPGIISDVTKLRRGITPKLSIKLGEGLGVEDDYFMLLQANYKVGTEKKDQILKSQKTPDLSILRRQIFWDIDFDKIDFIRFKSYVIQRIFERGNESEIKEIIRFYGEEECKMVIREARNLFVPAVANAENYLNIKKSEIKCLQNSNGKQYQQPWLRY
ncbi:MAG TPA: plasmid maintenance system antidote protein [Bacteroides sp.]|nr:plasmid maintenance system antidote protein [Bacteroides sp.]